MSAFSGRIFCGSGWLRATGLWVVFCAGCVSPAANGPDVTRYSLDTVNSVPTSDSRLSGWDERAREIERSVGVR